MDRNGTDENELPPSVPHLLGFREASAVRDVGVASSNLATPTSFNFLKTFYILAVVAKNARTHFRATDRLRTVSERVRRRSLEIGAGMGIRSFEFFHRQTE